MMVTHVCAALFLAAPPASAQTQNEPRAGGAATLRDAVEIALAQSSERASLPALGAQAEALRRAGHGPFAGPPAVSTDLLTRAQGVIEEEGSVSAGIRWPGEGRALRIYAGRVDDAAQSGLDAARLRIAGAVRAAWWALAAARAAVAVGRTQVEIAITNSAQVARLEIAGEHSRRDLLLAQAEAATAQSRLARAESALADAEVASIRVVEIPDGALWAR